MRHEPGTQATLIVLWFLRQQGAQAGEVTDIGLALGYEDPAYFSRFFVRAVGQPPSAYRESIHSGVRKLESTAPGR